MVATAMATPRRQPESRRRFVSVAFQPEDFARLTRVIEAFNETLPPEARMKRQWLIIEATMKRVAELEEEVRRRTEEH
jgi:hypothetical protein